MAGPFEAATRAAIEDLILSHSSSSKFGMVLTHENAQLLVDALFQLLLTSRNLKSMGDRMMQTPPPRATPQARPSPHGKKVSTSGEKMLREKRGDLNVGNPNSSLPVPSTFETSQAQQKKNQGSFLGRSSPTPRRWS